MSDLNQQIFNTVVTHLRKQGEPAMDGTNCQYKSSKGLTCAVGCLIKPKYYTKEIEGSPVDDPTVSEVVAKSLSVKEEELPIECLLALQEVHDDYRVSDWEPQLSIIAKVYNLTLPED